MRRSHISSVIENRLSHGLIFLLTTGGTAVARAEISGCDQWQLVKDGESDVCKNGWNDGHDLNFGVEQAKAVGSQ